MQEYMGDAITFSEGTQYWRIYWSHIRYFFYVYSYASGDLISKSMESLLHQGKISIEQIKDFLSAGRNASPKETFLKMGIDIAQPEFWKAGLEEMQKYLSETEELAKRLGKVI
ncbi:MAG: M3 family metallopeptidase [Candidatus Peribacteria bacterium]|jgi:oligoendopeptidase F|nr:M3 family metallopeptidase [Candidatus Peribacteria bacterium]